MTTGGTRGLEPDTERAFLWARREFMRIRPPDDIERCIALVQRNPEFPRKISDPHWLLERLLDAASDGPARDD
jgi:hypothetical protein